MMDIKKLLRVEKKAKNGEGDKKGHK